jgi:hypothetical protein
LPDQLLSIMIRSGYSGRPRSQRCNIRAKVVVGDHVQPEPAKSVTEAIPVFQARSWLLTAKQLD